MLLSNCKYIYVIGVWITWNNQYTQFLSNCFMAISVIFTVSSLSSYSILCLNLDMSCRLLPPSCNGTQASIQCSASFHVTSGSPFSPLRPHCGMSCFASFHCWCLSKTELCSCSMKEQHNQYQMATSGLWPQYYYLQTTFDYHYSTSSIIINFQSRRQSRPR